MNLKSVLLVAAAVVALPAPRSAVAQSPLDGLAISVGPGFERYSFSSPENAGLKSVSLFSAPASARATVAGPLWLQLSGGYASGTMIDARGREITLSGPLDTEVSLGLNMGRGPYTAALTGVAVTPTGSGRHTLAEAQVASVIATEFLPFGIRSWGGGGSAGVALMTTRTLGQGSVGVGAGFLSSRQYSPFRNPDSDGSAGADFVYQPGNRLQLRAAAERNLTRSSRLTLGFTFERTNADVMEENDLFRPGNRYQALGSYAFVLGGRSTAILYTGGMRADGGVVLDPVLINDFSSRTLGLVGAGMRVPVGGVILVPDLGGRIYRRGSGLGQGYIGDAGLAMELPSGPHAITSGARFRYGNLVAGEGMESRITGVDLTLNVRFGR